MPYACVYRSLHGSNESASKTIFRGKSQLSEFYGLIVPLMEHPELS